MNKSMFPKTSVGWALTFLAVTTLWCATPGLAGDRVVLGELFVADWCPCGETCEVLEALMDNYPTTFVLVTYH